MVLSPLQETLRSRLAVRSSGLVLEPDIKEAAVAVVVGSDPDSLLVIRRSEREGDPWSGHMGLPGGRREPGDPDLLATAVRETAEEVGVDLGEPGYLGQLDDVAPRSLVRPPIFARPFVFAVERSPLLTPNHEVAAAWWIPLSVLRDPGSYRDFAVRIGGVGRVFPAYHVSQGTIWGMTERVVTALLSVAS